jgi:hypothetical protein
MKSAYEQVIEFQIPTSLSKPSKSKRNFRHRGGTVRLKKDQIERLSDIIFSDLETAQLISLKTGKKQILETIRGVIINDMKSEEDLEKEAERILDQTLRATGGGTGIDRHKMLRMIKEKLAKERNIVL